MREPTASGVAILTALALVALVALVVILSGCADRRPTCYDNPRNMACMSADELERELNKP